MSLFFCGCSQKSTDNHNTNTPAFNGGNGTMVYEGAEYDLSGASRTSLRHILGVVVATVAILQIRQLFWLTVVCKRGVSAQFFLEEGGAHRIEFDWLKWMMGQVGGPGPLIRAQMMWMWVMIEKAEPHTLIEGKPTNPPLSSKRKADREDGIFLKNILGILLKDF